MGAMPVLCYEHYKGGCYNDVAVYMEVEGARPRGRPRKTWLEVDRNNCRNSALQMWMIWTAMLGKGRL